MLGLILNAIESTRPLAFDTFRIPGVLQRIAIVYAMVALTTETLGERGQAALVTAVLAIYWAAMMWVPVPGVGAGVLTPAGNLASWMDRHLFGRHMLTSSVRSGGIAEHLPRVHNRHDGRLRRTLAPAVGPARGARSDSGSAARP